MTSFLSNDKSFNCQTAYMTASCTTTIADTVSTAVNKCQSNVLNALQSLQNKLDMSTPNGIREQILANASILFPIFLPDKLISTLAKPYQHIPPLHLALLRNDSDQFQAMVFYGRSETSRKAHFLFSAPADNPFNAMQQLLLLTTRLVKEQALQNFYPSQELLYVAQPEGGYMKQTARQPQKFEEENHRDDGDGSGRSEEEKFHRCCADDDVDDRAFWWSSTHACNPEFHRNLAAIEREIDALGEDYFSDAGDSGRLEESKWDHIKQSAAAAAMW